MIKANASKGNIRKETLTIPPTVQILSIDMNLSELVENDTHH